MFIISYLLVNIGLPNFLGDLLSKITNKLFKAKKEASFIFFMSLITGFPSSAKNIKELLEESSINNNDASKILLFTFFSNPLFIINTIGIMFLNNKKLGIIILISHILGNIIIGIISRKYFATSNDNKVNLYNSSRNFYHKLSNTNIIAVIFKAIKDSLSTLVMIFGIITFFLIITSIIENTFNLNTISKIIITSILEMTTGLKNLSLSNININLKAIISSMIVSFGGLSVHAQIMNILENKKVKYFPFLIARISHALISGSLTFLFLLL